MITGKNMAFNIGQLLCEAKDLQKKLDAVNTMLVAYGHEIVSSTSHVSKEKNTSKASSNKTHKVRERCLPLITAQNGVPIKTRDILNTLKSEGFEIGGKNERATLSAMLSNTGYFTAIGRSGWVLKKND